jgi:NADPH:quinone reductase-like Zn-dependent oxidoreductase
VDYDREDLKSRIRELTDDGARIVIDPVGGPYSEPALRGLARGGTFVTLGYAAGAIPAIPLNLVLLKDICVRGMEIRTFMSDHPDQAIRDGVGADVRRRHHPPVHRRAIPVARDPRGAALCGRAQGPGQGGHRGWVTNSGALQFARA